MNRNRPRVVKGGGKKSDVSAPPEFDKVELTSEARASLLARLEAIKRNANGTLNMVKHLRADIASGNLKGHGGK